MFLQTVVDQFGASETVPEALYLLGLSRSKMNGGTNEDRGAARLRPHAIVATRSGWIL